VSPRQIHFAMAFRTSDKNRPNLTMVPTQASSRTSFHSFSPSSRENINPHSRTFSIARVRRKRQRLPSSLVIESAVKISVQLHLAAPALPMNASDFWLPMLIATWKFLDSVAFGQDSGKIF